MTAITPSGSCPIGGLETIVDGFKSEDEANNWIFSQQIVAVTDDKLSLAYLDRTRVDLA